MRVEDLFYRKSPSRKIPCVVRVQKRTRLKNRRPTDEIPLLLESAKHGTAERDLHADIYSAVLLQEVY